jgi:hypothetical protein
MFSTLVGGNELDYHYRTSVNALALDASDRIYIAGATNSPTLPVTSNADQPANGGGFVMRISNVGDALQFSAYVGGGCQGSCSTYAQAIVVDRHGITVAGRFWSEREYHLCHAIRP